MKPIEKIRFTVNTGEMECRQLDPLPSFAFTKL